MHPRVHLRPPQAQTRAPPHMPPIRILQGRTSICVRSPLPRDSSLLADPPPNYMLKFSWYINAQPRASRATSPPPQRVTNHTPSLLSGTPCFPQLLAGAPAVTRRRAGCTTSSAGRRSQSRCRGGHFSQRPSVPGTCRLDGRASGRSSPPQVMRSETYSLTKIRRLGGPTNLAASFVIYRAQAFIGAGHPQPHRTAPASYSCSFATPLSVAAAAPLAQATPQALAL